MTQNEIVVQLFCAASRHSIHVSLYLQGYVFYKIVKFKYFPTHVWVLAIGKEIVRIYVRFKPLRTLFESNWLHFKNIVQSKCSEFKRQQYILSRFVFRLLSIIHAIARGLSDKAFLLLIIRQFIVLSYAESTDYAVNLKIGRPLGKNRQSTTFSK